MGDFDGISKGAGDDTIVVEGGLESGLWLEADRAEALGALGALRGDKLGVGWWLALGEVGL